VTEPGAPAGPAPPREPEAGRAAHVIAQLYYYFVAAIGVALVLGGVIGGLFGIRALVLPNEFQEPRDAVRTMLHGLAFALPGALLLWWHLREARRGERRSVSPAFWGRSLYFHLVAFVALWFVVGGMIAMLSAGVDAAVPHCFAVEEQAVPAGYPRQDECYPEPTEAGRQAIDGAIFVIAAAPVWWWHLRQGRRATQPGITG
jgi:hypothetical protein